MAIDPLQRVQIDYTNYRGERGLRVIIPSRLFFGSTDYHPEAQWLLEAHDLDRDAMRTFALKDIHSWTPIATQGETAQLL